jgi:hypothetical protein
LTDKNPQCNLQHEFGPEDSPVVFWVLGNDVHLTGNWLWDDDADDNQSSDSCSEEANTDAPLIDSSKADEIETLG